LAVCASEIVAIALVSSGSAGVKVAEPVLL
jgi:hypothetical protein